MSVLLRQASGFEGLGPGVDDSPAYGLSPAQCPYMPGPQVDLDATGFPAPVGMYCQEDIVTSRNALLYLDVMVLESVPEGFQELRDIGMSSIGPFVKSTRRDIHFDFWVHPFQRRDSTTAVPAFVQPPDDLHVLLRHRPRSIPPSCAPAYGSGGRSGSASSAPPAASGCRWCASTAAADPQRAPPSGVAFLALGGGARRRAGRP